MKIFKYQLEEDGIILPAKHKILHIGMQGDSTPTVWAAVDPDDDSVRIKMYVLPTGADVNTKQIGDYVTTLVTAEGFVWHVFKES